MLYFAAVRSLNRPSPDPGRACELVGVAGFEPAASSSRTPPPREQGHWQPTYIQVTAVCAATLTASDHCVHESGRSRFAPKIGPRMRWDLRPRLRDHSPGRRRLERRDLPLRRSFHAAGQLATFLVRASLLNFWLQLNVSGFRPVLARGWHGAHIRASWQ